MKLFFNTKSNKCVASRTRKIINIPLYLVICMISVLCCKVISEKYTCITYETSTYCMIPSVLQACESIKYGDVIFLKFKMFDCVLFIQRLIFSNRKLCFESRELIWLFFIRNWHMWSRRNYPKRRQDKCDF